MTRGKRSHHTTGSNPSLSLRNSERGGSLNPNAKLKDSDVVMMREYRAGGWSHKDLALLFGMSESRCSEICRGKGYKHVGGPIETEKALYFSSVGARREKLSLTMAGRIKDLHTRGQSHGEIAQSIYDDTGTEISKSLVGLVLRGRTKY